METQINRQAREADNAIKNPKTNLNLSPDQKAVPILTEPSKPLKSLKNNTIIANQANKELSTNSTNSKSGTRIENNPKQLNKALVDNARTRNLITTQVVDNKRLYKVKDKPQLEAALNKIPTVKADALVAQHNQFAKYTRTENINTKGLSFKKTIESKVAQKDQVSNLEKSPIKERKDIQLTENGLKVKELSKALKENKTVTIKGEGKEIKFEDNKISIVNQQKHRQEASSNLNKVANVVGNDNAPQKAKESIKTTEPVVSTVNKLPNKIKTMDDEKLDKVLVKNATSGQNIGRKFEDGKYKYQVIQQPEATKRLNDMPMTQANEIFKKNNDYVKEMASNRVGQKTISFKENILPKVTSKEIER